jgi:hypothetical protein
MTVLVLLCCLSHCHCLRSPADRASLIAVCLYKVRVRAPLGINCKMS